MRTNFFLFIFCALALNGPMAWASGPLYPVQRTEWQTLKLSATDRDAIGRVTYAEAANQGDTGMAAVVYVILNRLVSGEFGTSVPQIINAKNQFEPATRAGGWEKLPILTPQQQARIDTIINLALDGRLPDPTNGSIFFQNPAIVAQREAAGKASKGLTRFNGSTPAAVIRDHEFYAKVINQKMTPVLVQADRTAAPEPWDIYAWAHRHNLQESASWDIFTQEKNKRDR